ncbi:MAG: S8 family serine peptidase [Cyanobacteriota bacterium]
MIKKRLISSVLVAGYVLGAASLSKLLLPTAAIAQTQATDELYYTFFDKKIPLSVRSDAIAVAFKPVGRVRGSSSATPLHLRLQQDLQKGAGNTRGSTRSSTLAVEVNPLAEGYALVRLPSQTRSRASELQQQIQQRDYVETTLPVLMRREAQSSARSYRDESVMVLPNEIIISFEPEVSATQKQQILTKNNLEILRQLRFTQNRYVVRSKTASGTAILSVANQLNSLAGVESATPNFIQTLPKQSRLRVIKPGDTLALPSIPSLRQNIAQAPQARKSGIQAPLLPLQWHLNSTIAATCLNQRTEDDESVVDSLWDCSSSLAPSILKTSSSLTRTDIGATEAWQKSNQGKGVVVAVLDSLIQWDHPDLINSLYTVGNVPDKLPGEKHGWDFVENDSDTRISKNELVVLSEKFQDTFELTDTELLKLYPKTAEWIAAENADYSKEQIANFARYILRNQDVVGEFHGTMVAGVVAAQPQGDRGVMGVAPLAQILPVRISGVGDGASTDTMVQAIAYAASRGVDVINISFGSKLPLPEVVSEVNRVLKANPNLVIVASAGNNNEGSLMFPSAIPGVVSVGATNLAGERARYSNYGREPLLGQGLTVVAPGGDTSSPLFVGGILTTGGTWLDGFWEGISEPNFRWGPVLDNKGAHVWVNGTSFSAPAVAGVLALMKGEDPKRLLDRDRLVAILKQTASYKGLMVAVEEEKLFNAERRTDVELSSLTVQQYFFGSGIVNADAAIAQIKQSRQR